ncbi:MAG: preprotein translocase subunit SecG [Bauldia sp.]
METVLIVIHLMVVIALVGVVLLQRSEGGALGIGGSSGFLTSRGQANVLTRSTAILAAAFFATSIALTLIAKFSPRPESAIQPVTAPANAPGAPPAGPPITTIPLLPTAPPATNTAPPAPAPNP